MPLKEIKNKDTDYLPDNLQRNVLLCTFDPLAASVTLHNGLNLEPVIIFFIMQSLLSEL